MKKIIFSLIVFSLCICYGITHAYPAQLTAIVNPFLNKVLCIKNRIEFSPEIFAEIKIDEPNAENSATYISKVFDNGNALRIKQEFDLGKGLKNVRNLYAKDNTVICLDSISPNILEISNINNEDTFRVLEFRKLFFDVYTNIKNIESIKNAKLIKSEGILTASWQDEYDHMAIINSDTKLVEEYIVRTLNGDLYKKVEFKKNDPLSWTIVCRLYNPNNTLFVTNTLQISIVKDDLFANDLEPKGFGYKEVIDTRNNQERKYIAVERLPTMEFIDELFKNSDDIVRYNKEMSRFAPMKCDSCSKTK